MFVFVWAQKGQITQFSKNELEIEFHLTLPLHLCQAKFSVKIEGISFFDEKYKQIRITTAPLRTPMLFGVNNMLTEENV